MQYMRGKEREGREREGKKGKERKERKERKEKKGKKRKGKGRKGKKRKEGKGKENIVDIFFLWGGGGILSGKYLFDTELTFDSSILFQRCKSMILIVTH